MAYKHVTSIILNHIVHFCKEVQLDYIKLNTLLRFRSLPYVIIVDIKADQLNSLKKFYILSENVIFHE